MTAMPQVVMTMLAVVVTAMLGVAVVVVVLVCAVVSRLVAVLLGRLKVGAALRRRIVVPLEVMGCVVVAGVVSVRIVAAVGCLGGATVGGAAVPSGAVGHVVTFGAGVVLRHRRGGLYSVAGICALPPGVDKDASRAVQL